MYSAAGLQLASRFAFPPNSLHYCGPPKERDLAGYIRHAVVDKGLSEILVKFETLYPYLVLIAHANNIRDPFDPRVVKAYWIGNALLQNIDAKTMYTHLIDGIGLKRKSQLDQLAPGFPHHTFHVMNIFQRTGHTHTPQTLETIDACRIRKAVVTGIHPDGSYEVEVEKLTILHEKFKKGVPARMTMQSLERYGVGDTVAVHWGFICGILPMLQEKQLAFYTRKSIQYANTVGFSAIDKLSGMSE